MRKKVEWFSCAICGLDITQKLSDRHYATHAREGLMQKSTPYRSTRPMWFTTNKHSEMMREYGRFAYEAAKEDGFIK